MRARSVSSSLPAAPTNGSPCRSSLKPGASPTIITSAGQRPTPGTAWVRVAYRPQSLQDRMVSWSSLRELAGIIGERFGDPGGPDSGEATSSGASALLIRERAAHELSPKMGRMGAEDPPTRSSAESPFPGERPEHQMKKTRVESPRVTCGSCRKFDG